MGRSLDFESQFSASLAMAPRVKKKQGVIPDRRAASSDKRQQRHGEGRTMLARVPEEEERPGDEDRRRRRWLVRVRRGKLVTPVVRHLQRFRRACTTMAAMAAAPLRCYKLGEILAKLHLSRKRSSRKIHSVFPGSSSSDEHAPLLLLRDCQV